MGRVLFINYDFPPALSGVRRIVKFCRYLPESGWEACVLCARPYDPLGRDEKALAEIQQLGITVTRTRSMDPLSVRAAGARLLCWLGLKSLQRRRQFAESAPSSSPGGVGRGQSKMASFFKRLSSFLRPFFLPDDRVGWIPFATLAGLKILLSKTTRPEVIVTSSFPNSAHIVGLILWTIFGVRWVADFRDGWVQNPYFGPPPRGVRRWVQQFLEDQVVRCADAVVTVSQPIADHLLQRRGRGGVVVIPNGFDPEDRPAPCPEIESGLIVYTGTFFGGRSPRVFFEALRQVMFGLGLGDALPRDDGGEGAAPAKPRGKFLTRLDQKDLNCIEEFGLSGVVDILPMAAHGTAIEWQYRADLLLLVEPEGPGSEIMLTQKVFEYLATGRPILAQVPDGACRSLLMRTGGAYIVRPDDVEGTRHAIGAWLTGLPPAPRDEAYIATLSRPAQAQALAMVLHGVTSD